MAEQPSRTELKKAVVIFSVSIIAIIWWYYGLCVNSADDIRAAVLQYQIADHRMGRVVFVSINGKDPSDAFLKRIEKQLGLLKKASLCCDMRPKPQHTFPKYTFDKETGESAVVYGIGRIVPVGFHTVRVSGSYYCGELCAGGGYYRVVRTDDGWFVEEFDQMWISRKGFLKPLG